jgi:hypothetical protein
MGVREGQGMGRGVIPKLPLVPTAPPSASGAGDTPPGYGQRTSAIRRFGRSRWRGGRYRVFGGGSLCGMTQELDCR